MSGFQLITDGKGLDNSLVAGWNMGQGPAGYVHDVSSYGHIGTLVGPPRQGRDGFGDFLGCAASDAIDLGSSITAGTERTHVFYLRSTQASFGYLVQHASPNFLVAWAYGGFFSVNIGGVWYDGGTIYNDGRIHRIDVVLDGVDNLAVYADGVKFIDETVSLTSLGGAARLMSSTSAGALLAGDLYLYAIYNKAKSLAWVEQEHNRMKRHL